jgi:formylglycine-generating enzyme required for sulfatase activity
MGLVVVGILAGVGGGYLLLTLLKPSAPQTEADGRQVAVARDAGAQRPIIDAGSAQVVIPTAPVDAGQPAVGDAQRREDELRAQEERKLAELKAEEERKRAEALAKAAQDAGKETEPAEKQGCPSGMRLIASGSFKMGASREDPMMGFDEKPLASVQLGAYCIDFFEFPDRKGASPTTGVSYQAADAACHSKGKRLCTEEEWEHACKGPSGLRFPYGNSFDAEACNTEDAAGEDRTIAATGQFTRCRSGFGVSDMSGNVAEWTSSKYNDELSDRTLKGGAFDRPDYATRCAARKNGPVGTRNDKIGFRCCADPK